MKEFNPYVKNISSLKSQYLRDFIESDDYKMRFAGEIMELSYRINRLTECILKIEMGDFKPTCDITILRSQLYAMQHYRYILILRAQIENIMIPEVSFYDDK